MLFGETGARHHRGDLLLLDHLPTDEIFDVGVIDIHDHHFGGAPRGAAGFDGTGCPVPDFQEAHQAGGAAAAGKALVLTAQAGEIGAGAGAIFEQPGFPRPQIHDAALVDEVVVHALDETGMRLRMFVGRGRLHQPSGDVVDIEMALARPVDAIGPVEAGVEPLRRVGGGPLGRQHMAHFVIEGARVGLGVEIAAFPAPIGPGACHAMEHLLGRNLTGQRGAFVGFAPPQPFRYAVFGNLFQLRRHARFAEIFLGQHVARHLAPRLGDFDAGLLENDRSVGVADLAGTFSECDRLIG